MSEAPPVRSRTDCGCSPATLSSSTTTMEQCSAKPTLPLAIRFYIYAIHGWVMEVAFTACWNFVVTRDWRLLGHTSVWSLFVYGINAVAVEQLYNRHLRKISVILRLPIFIFMGYVWEYLCGFVLRTFDACPWDYSDRRWQLHGLITMEYLPAWAFCYVFCENFLFIYSCEKLRISDSEEDEKSATVINAGENTPVDGEEASSSPIGRVNSSTVIGGGALTRHVNGFVPEDRAEVEEEYPSLRLRKRDKEDFTPDTQSGATRRCAGETGTQRDDSSASPEDIGHQRWKTDKTNDTKDLRGRNGFRLADGFSEK